MKSMFEIFFFLCVNGPKSNDEKICGNGNLLCYRSLCFTSAKVEPEQNLRHNKKAKDLLPF